MESMAELLKGCGGGIEKGVVKRWSDSCVVKGKLGEREEDESLDP